MPRRRLSSRLAIPLGLAFFLAIGWLADRTAGFKALRDALQIQTVPAPLLNRGSLGGMLRRLRLVRPVANDNRVYVPSPYSRTPLNASLFQKKRVVGDTLYAPNPDWLEELATRPEPPLPVVRPDQFRTNWPLIAINVDPEDLYSRKWGILTHYTGHGREWERRATMAYYVDGREVFATRAGLRLHGGKSRLPDNVHSYRLHFREEYGAVEFKRGVLFTPSNEPIRRLVVHADWPEAYPFAGLLAFDMAERLGGTVPRTQPVVLVLNGKVQERMFWLSEHVGRTAWANRIGHNEFQMHIVKGEQEPISHRNYGGFHRWVLKTPEPLDLAEAEARADLDNLSAYVLAVAYGGATDGFQGAALFDPRAERPRWAWITWDLDHSFWDVYGDRSQREPWEKGSWDLIYKTRAYSQYVAWRNAGDARSVLFTRLMNHSPVFRARFLRYVTDMLNHRLTEAFLRERIARYEQLARDFGRTNFAFADDYREFARRRPALLREGLRQLFAAGAVRRVEVRAPAGTALMIDGFPETAPYAGHYFDGQTVAVEAVGKIAGWQVNGAPAEAGPRFAGPVTEDLLLEPAP